MWLCDLFFLCCCWCSFVLQEQRQHVRLSGSLLVVDEVRTRDFQNTRPHMQELPASPFQQYDGCSGLLILILQPLQTFVEPARYERVMTSRAEFQFSWVYTFSATPRSLRIRAPVPPRETGCDQHSLRNCVDHLAALSHIGCTIRWKLGLLSTFIDQPRGNDSITFRFFRCPGVFAIVMVSFSSLIFLIFAK